MSQTSMSRIWMNFLVAVSAICFSVCAVGQQNAAQQSANSASSQNDRPAPARTAEITIQGCVSGAKRYTFMQASTGAIFDLTGKTDSLAPVRGKLIEITASEFSPGAKSNELPKLHVNNLRVIANKCPIQARAESRTENTTSTHQGPPAPETSPSTRRYSDPGTVDQTPPNVNNPNISGDTGAPSPGTGNPPSPPQ